MNKTRRLKTLIIDDEFLARERIKKLLAADDDIEIVGECANGLEAIQAIGNQKPDFIFLDVQMPELDGFGVLENLGAADHLPLVIFVTAYDQYAIKAFEVRALDYLLKPFNRQRFSSALSRAKAQLQQQETGLLHHRIDNLLLELQQRREPVRRLVIQSAGRVFFLRLDEIDFVKAAGNYLELHADEENYLYRDTMSRFEQKLDPGEFVRIHRSIIINVSQLKSLKRLPNGDFVVFLKDGRSFASGRGYRENVQRLLKSSLT